MRVWSKYTQLTRTVSRIALVREGRARAIEDLLIRMARSQQLRGRVTEEQLLGLLDQIEASEGKQTGSRITVRFFSFLRFDARRSQDGKAQMTKTTTTYSV